MGWRRKLWFRFRPAGNPKRNVVRLFTLLFLPSRSPCSSCAFVQGTHSVRTCAVRSRSRSPALTPNAAVKPLRPTRIRLRCGDLQCLSLSLSTLSLISAVRNVSRAQLHAQIAHANRSTGRVFADAKRFFFFSPSKPNLSALQQQANRWLGCRIWGWLDHCHSFKSVDPAPPEKGSKRRLGQSRLLAAQPLTRGGYSVV